jgi:hypothetical protein
MIGLEPDERAYRRGLVLGWSLAEVFLLIVFALLFAFAALATKLPSEPRTGQMRPSPTPASARPGTPPNSFDSLFHKLTLCEASNASLTSEIRKLNAESENLKRENAVLKAEIARLNTAIVKPKGANQGPLQSKANNQFGGGADYPPCFKNPSGRPDYIFDVTLGSTGIMVHKNDLPAHAAEEIHLPLDQITYDHELNDESFIGGTAGLFSYSEAHACRFFVRICDQTKADEKDVYKRRLQVVESHFYQLPVNCETPDRDNGDR